MFEKFGEERRKNQGDRKIESDLHENRHKMRLESLDNQLLDCVLLKNFV